MQLYTQVSSMMEVVDSVGVANPHPTVLLSCPMPQLLRPLRRLAALKAVTLVRQLGQIQSPTLWTTQMMPA